MTNLEIITKANELGKTAFYDHKKCVPAHDTELMEMLGGVEVGRTSTLALFRSWLDGWEEAHLVTFNPDDFINSTNELTA